MPRRVKQPLSVKRVEAVCDPGMHCDGNGLYLKVSGAYGKSWICRTVVQGKRRDFGLGSANLVTLKEAREAAHQIRTLTWKGTPMSSNYIAYIRVSTQRQGESLHEMVVSALIPNIRITPRCAA